MNVTINGYVSFTCESCGHTHAIESNTFTYVEDTSLESKGDDYIRYISQVNTTCASCSRVVFIKFDIWEHPESVVNYSYYAEQGVRNTVCEFNIEHYYDSASVKEEDQPHIEAVEDDTQDRLDAEGDEDPDDQDKPFNEAESEAEINTVERYIDHYDNDN